MSANALESKSSREDMIATINELVEQVTALQVKVDELSAPKQKASVKEMTDADARRVIYGDLKSMKTKDAADLLGLSYGQIYSARGKYTFKHIHKEAEAIAKKATEEQQS